MYLQSQPSFTLSSGKVWHVKSNITCSSKNVIYYLKCNRCDGKDTYIGKTNNLRLRTNQHISTCRTGNGSNIFDQHVHHCKNEDLEKPFLKLHPLLALKDEHCLLSYESHFHSLGYDTLNRN